MMENHFRFFNSIDCVLSLARVIIGGGKISLKDRIVKNHEESEYSRAFIYLDDLFFDFGVRSRPCLLY